MKNLLIIIFTLTAFGAFAQNNPQTNKETKLGKYRISLPGIILPQMVTKSWNNRKHTQHIEFHLKRDLDEKNIIGVKFATWRLFQPMGIQWWDGLLDKVDSESEFYPGHVRTTGVGFTYQRMLWKGLFATVEVLPQYKTYLDENNNSIANGFQLYNSYHLGYHIGFGKKKRFFIEPQIHFQHWMFSTNTPDEFKEFNDQWSNYFLFEPNLYFGVRF